MKKRNWKTKRFLEIVHVNCPNCDKDRAVRIYEEAGEFDCKTGKPTEDGWDFVHGEGSCSCGAAFFVADNYESVGLYWINKDKMPTEEELKYRRKQKAELKPKLPQGQQVLLCS